MDILEALRSRRSVARLVSPSPGDDEISRYLELAMNAPDHANLRPWRLVLVRGRAREQLGWALAEAEGSSGVQAGRTAAKPLRAPLLIGVVFQPRDHPKVPEWEQLAATVGVVTNLGLVLHAHGWGAMWRTGRLIDTAPVRRAMRAGPGERLLGWLYVGRENVRRTVAPRTPRPAVGERISVLTAAYDLSAFASREPR